MFSVKRIEAHGKCIGVGFYRLSVAIVTVRHKVKRVFELHMGMHLTL